MSDDDVLIKVEGVSKKFCRSLKRSMVYGMHDIAREALGLPVKSAELRPEEFWAVEDVSFDVRRGECLGIIGPNGAGKSTLLKILSGIMPPDKGKITVRGRVGALIELGAGFHPLLTGRENIYLSGAILGLSKKEIDAKFDEIVTFAELESFIDAPVKNYSSGMYVRLGFAVASQIQPDILLLDEVLAVGDVGFRAKCYNKIASLQDFSAVIFVSHSIPAVGRICDNLIVLSAGRALSHGDVQKGITTYFSLFNKMESIQSIEEKACIYMVKIYDSNMNEINSLLYGESAEIDIHVIFKMTIENPVINLDLMDISGDYVCQTNSEFYNFKTGLIYPGKYLFKVRIKSIQLKPGRYKFSIVVHDDKGKEFIAWSYGKWYLDISNSFPGTAAYQIESEWSNSKIKSNIDIGD